MPRRRPGSLIGCRSRFLKCLPRRLEQQGQSFPRCGRHGIQRDCFLLQVRAKFLEPRRVVERVDLVRGDDNRLVLQPFARGVTTWEQRQLARDRFEVLHRITPAPRGNVHHVDQHARALEMAEKTMPEPDPLVRPFDQSRYVRRDERSIAGETDDAEVRRERGEGVIGDLRLGGGDARDDRGLAGVRISDDADVSEQLQLQAKVFLFTGKAGLRPARRAIGRGRVARVTLSAETAPGDDDRLAFFGEVRDPYPLVSALLEDLRAHGNFEREVGSGLSRPQRAFALRAVPGLEGLLKPVVEEGIEVGARDEINAAAVTAVTAVGAAPRHELLAAEAQGALAPVSCRDVDLYFVNEHLYLALGARRDLALFQRKDRDDPALGAVVGELHGAVDLREKRVVLAQPDVEAGAELAPALAHE